MRKVAEIVRLFSSEEYGVQIIEYALIVAMVALLLLIALRDVTGANFGGFVSRVTVCLNSSAACS